jgi:ribonuclease P protein subunit POP4
MPITPQNLARHELIGLKVNVSESSDPTQEGLKGTVIDETYNTLRIEAGGKEKVVPKKDAVFIFTLPGKAKVQVDGSLLVSRPEDRIKKKFARW